MSIAIDLAVNPANPNQRYILYANGYIEPRGGALPIDQEEFGYDPFTGGGWTTYNHKAPTFYQAGWESARRLQIISWATPSGYTLDCWGHIFPWGGAADIPGVGAGAPFTNGPEFFFGSNGGFPVLPYGYVVGFMMDPANSGKGYFCMVNGAVYSAGTGVTVVPQVAFLNDKITPARDFVMDWATKRYWILDSVTRVWGGNGGNNAGVDGSPALQFNIFADEGTTYDMVLYDVSTADPKGWQMGDTGRVRRIGTAQNANAGQPYNPSYNGWRGVGVVDAGLGSTPLRLVCMSQEGNFHEYIVSTAPTAFAISPTESSTNTATTRPYLAWTYQDPDNDAPTLFELSVISSTVYSVGGVNEVQTITITGAPTGGSYILNFLGSPTVAIAYNAAIATIQAALEALPTIGTGGLVVAGGPLPGTPVTVTFQNHMGSWNQPQITATHTFTGGTTPAIAVTTTTAGVGIDPATATAVYRGTVTDPSLRQLQVPNELANATYRFFVRATDSSGLVSLWNSNQWIQNVTPPATPTVTPNVLGGTAGISLALSVNPSGLSASARFAIQYHDSDWDGVTWEFVRGGWDVDPDAGGLATLVDYEARFGIVRSYRVLTYIYDTTTDVWNASVWSTTATATLGPRNLWTLVNPFLPTGGKVVSVKSFKKSRSVVAGVFFPVNRYDPIVVSDGRPKAPKFDLNLWLRDGVERAAVETMLDSDAVLLLKDPFGNIYYIKLTDPVQEELLRGSPLPSEQTPLRDLNEMTVGVQVVRRPTAAPLVGPLAF